MTAGMLILAGCGKKETEQAGEYTNLADKESRKAVVGELEACGVTKEQTSTLEKWAEDDHEIIAKSYSYPKGFTDLPESGMYYRIILMNDSADSYSYLQVSNCRLTAFNLIKNPLTTVGAENDTDLWLMFDIETIDAMPEDQARFVGHTGVLSETKEGLILWKSIVPLLLSRQRIKDWADLKDYLLGKAGLVWK